MGSVAYSIPINLQKNFERSTSVFPNQDTGKKNPWWRHQMEIFSALLAICVVNSPLIGEFPAQRPVTRSFDIFFDLCMNDGWVNNRGAGDLRRHRAHYDITMMPMNYINASSAIRENVCT